MDYGVRVVTGDSKSFSLGSNPSSPTMEVTFKYNGKIITTPNLEKKLKRLKISIDDIEIIETPIKEKKSNEGIEDYMLDKERIIVRSTKDEIRRVCYIQKGTRPPFKKLFEKIMWNPQTKTGIKEITEDYIKKMYYDE